MHADTACREAKHSLSPSGRNCAVSQPILDADKQNNQEDLTLSSCIITDSSPQNTSEFSNNATMQCEQEYCNEASSFSLDQCEVTEAEVIDCLDNVMVINKHLCNVKQGAESQYCIKQGSESVSCQGKQGSDLIFNTKAAGDSMADSVTGKSEADSLSQVIYCLVRIYLHSFMTHLSPLLSPEITVKFKSPPHFHLDLDIPSQSLC
jgi:hypothetical protein